MARPKGHIISSMLLRWGHGVTLHISSPPGSHYTSMPSCSRGHMPDYHDVALHDPCSRPIICPTP